MNIVFLSWGEVPRLSSVYGGQLVNVAAQVSQAGANKVTLVAGMPIIHSGLVREKWNYGKQLEGIRRRLGKDNFFCRKLFVPPVGIYPTEAQLKFFKFNQMRSMISLLRKLQPQILHCRSYVATFMAHEWRKHSELDYKILFDTRSYMPDEAIQRGRWKENSADHLFWRDTERTLLQESDAVNVVSEPMRTRFVGMGADPHKVHLIHLNVEPPKNSRGEQEVPAQPADRKGPLFCYCGYLDYSTWHHPSNIWKIFDQIVSLNKDARLLVITKSSHAMLKQDLNNKGFQHLLNNIEFTSAESSSECVRIMQHCDAGILAYFTPKTDLEFEMARGVFATKTAEYLYAGIPVLVNKVCGGAAQFVDEHQVGLSYDENQPLRHQEITRLLHFGADKKRLLTLAREKFDVSKNASRLVLIYQSTRY